MLGIIWANILFVLVEAAPGVLPTFLVTENGDNLVTENGDFLIQ